MIFKRRSFLSMETRNWMTRRQRVRSASEALKVAGPDCRELAPSADQRGDTWIRKRDAQPVSGAAPSLQEGLLPTDPP